MWKLPVVLVLPVEHPKVTLDSMFYPKIWFWKGKQLVVCAIIWEFMAPNTNWLFQITVQILSFVLLFSMCYYKCLKILKKYSRLENTLHAASSWPQTKQNTVKFENRLLGKNKSDNKTSLFNSFVKRWPNTMNT